MTQQKWAPAAPECGGAHASASLRSTGWARDASATSSAVRCRMLRHLSVRTGPGQIQYPPKAPTETVPKDPWVCARS
eukprot:5607024-Prymnesium_polylepis.3